jgi:hypothetical protein
MMTLLLGKFGTEMTPLVSLPFASMEADVKRTAGCKSLDLLVALVCSDHHGRTIHTRPGMQGDCSYSPAPRASTHSTALSVHSA